MKYKYVYTHGIIRQRRGKQMKKKIVSILLACFIGKFDFAESLNENSPYRDGHTDRTTQI